MCNVEGPPPKKPRIGKLFDDQPIPIYLDHNATTPPCEEAWTAMKACETLGWGNPSSAHAFGCEAKFVVERSRQSVATALGAATAAEILFTSGGTESNNLAIVGCAMAVRRRHPERDMIVSTNFEHPAVDEVLKFLSVTPYITEPGTITTSTSSPHSDDPSHERHATTPSGFTIQRHASQAKALPPFDILRCNVNRTSGVLDIDTFRAAIAQFRHRIALVTVMHANNELGTIQPVALLSRIVKEQSGGIAVMHTDAAQTIGKIPVNVSELGVDVLSVCSHKFYGPKGVGALYVKTGTPIERVTFGAGHERGIRPGTESIILGAGLAAALEKAVTQLESNAMHARTCRDELLKWLTAYLKKRHFEIRFNGDPTSTLPNTLNFAVFHVPTNMHVSSSRLISSLASKVAFSAGSACHAADEPGMHVSLPLQSVAVEAERAVGTLRLTTGQLSSVDDMRRAAQMIAVACGQQMPEP